MYVYVPHYCVRKTNERIHLRSYSARTRDIYRCKKIRSLNRTGLYFWLRTILTLRHQQYIILWNSQHNFMQINLRITYERERNMHATLYSRLLSLREIKSKSVCWIIKVRMGDGTCKLETTDTLSTKLVEVYTCMLLLTYVMLYFYVIELCCVIFYVIEN